ncbi:MAG: SRPBCC family protein [Bdellovibrionaceae bacterium]|nr:SRPBCC family protein [Bdellovibrionales bacterium]MCB9085208.1 SRPBCC family protein [Pseudobdellovibrionaceae bacterium]
MKKVLIAIGALVLVLVVGGLFLPNKYTASATYEFKHSKERLHGLIGNLETWREWGPWMEDDPGMKIELIGPSGVGAKQIWTSRKAGNGSLTFTKWDPESGITYDLEFDGWPRATAGFEYQDIEGGVRVHWSMDGKVAVPVIGGYLALFFKKMISSSFEQGLKNIDNVLSKNENNN